MQYKENKERKDRLSFLGKAAVGTVAGAFLLKESGGLKIASKAFDDLSRSVSKFSKDISKLSREELDSNAISKIAKEAFFDEDSVLKTARKNNMVRNLDQENGLFAAVRSLKRLENDQTILESKIADNVQAGEIIKNIQQQFKDQSKEFYEQIQVLTQEVLNKKQDYFQIENDSYKAIKSEFDYRLEKGILSGSKDELIPIFEEALNNSAEIADRVTDEYRKSLKPQLISEFKAQIKEKYSKEGDFFKNTLDQAAEVKDFLRAYQNNAIESNQANEEMFNFLSSLVNEDESWNNLKITKTLRVDKAGNVYSTQALDRAKNTIEDELADTIAGKLFGLRSHLLNKQAPDFYYLGQGTYDKILASLTNSESGLLEYDNFKLGNKIFQYKDSKLSEVMGSDNLYLIGGKHGPQATLLNTLAGNTAYNPVQNEAAKNLDIGTKGILEIKEKLSVLKKFKKDSQWAPNIINRIMDDTYDNIGNNPEKLQTYFKDLKIINKTYNDLTTNVSNRFIEQLKKSSNSVTVKSLLDSLDSNNIAQALLDNSSIDTDAFSNKDLTALLKRYKNNRETVFQTIHIGAEKGFGKGKNVLTYNELLKREVTKEALLKEAATKRSTFSGYAALKGRIEDLEVNGIDKKRAIDLLNWSILQKEGDMFTKDLHSPSSIAQRMEQYEKINSLFKTKRQNAQEQAFLESFQKNVKTFVKENSSIFESKVEHNTEVLRPFSTGQYVTMRKSIKISDILKDINDQTKSQSTAKKFIKQFVAGRNNMNDVTAATLYPFHLLNRLTTPLEGIGFGFSKESTKSSLDLVKNIGLKRILPALGLIYGYSYLNDTARDITGTSLSASYQNTKANFILGTKVITDKFGLEDAQKRKAMYNPIAKYWGGDYKDRDEYLEYLEYGYDPVRKGRYWNFGSVAEFRGTKISYWKPNKLRLAHSNYYDENVYGGSDNKWAHSWIPTPTHPFSTIRRLMNPYWLEKMHYEDRPYPVTGKLFSEGTPWGAILNPTIGQIVKPQKRMHQSELNGTLTDVRTIIANKNREIKQKSAEKSMAKINGSGFTPMSFNPTSMPSLNEAVFSIKLNNKGKVESAGFLGQGYADSLGNIDSAYIPSLNENSYSQIKYSGNASNGVGTGTGNYNSGSNNENQDSIISKAKSIVSIFAKNNFSYHSNGSAGNMVKQANASIFAKAERNRSGVINEIGSLQYQPSRVAAEKTKNEYLEKMISKESKNDFVHDMIYSAKELTGMYGFLSEKLLPPSKGYKLENANMTSFSNRFWDQSIGGIGGDFMEIARRFFPHSDHNIEQINPIRNTMPEWMPVRYQTGDPYTKLPLGDARLPGKGYESLNKLHSDQYGRYGAFDRYKILADIAPLSDEYKTWRKIAKQQIKDPFLKKQMEEIDKRVEGQTKEHDFYNYKFLGKKLESHKAIIESVSDDGKFKVVGDNEQYTLAGITPNKNEMYNYLKPGMKVNLKYENNEYTNRNSEGIIPTLVYSNGESITKQMFENKAGVENKDKETLADQYFALKDSNLAMGHVYEAVGHMPIPYLHNKFLRIDSPMESYKKEQIYGTNFSTWDHPIKGYIKPAFQQAWGNNLSYQALGIATFALSNIASKSDWSKGAKTLAHTAFVFTNPAGFAGGVMGYIPFMTLSSNQSKIGWNTRNLSNIGAVIGFTGFGLTHLNNPFLSAGNFAMAGAAITEQFFKETKNSKGALIGAAVGLGLSAIKNPGFSLNKITEKYIPKDTKKKWEIEEYYDRLEYLKYTNLYNKAARLAKHKEGIDVKKVINAFEYKREKNVNEIRKLTNEKERIQKSKLLSKSKKDLIANLDQRIINLSTPEQYFKMGEYTKSAIAYKKAADTTIYGLNDFASSTDVLRALPTYDRDYFLEFAKEKDPKKRKKILKYISPYKQKALRVLWKEDVKKSKQESNESYFKRHTLPNVFWAGWKPQVDLDNVKMRTIENEGMLLSDFGIYESNKNEPAYINAPSINSMKRPSNTLTMQRDLISLLNGMGLSNVDVTVDQTQESGIQIVSNITRVASYNLKEKIRNTLGNIL